jgi:Group II intron, maturase-specific domain
MVAVLAPLGLELHPAKTSIVHLHGGAQGFEFLGFHHHKVESWRRYYRQRWPSATAMAAVRTRVRDATSGRQVGRSLTSVAADLNPVLRGWGGYFRRGNSAWKFSTLDSYVQERLAILDNAKRGRPLRSWGPGTTASGTPGSASTTACGAGVPREQSKTRSAAAQSTARTRRSHSCRRSGKRQPGRRPHTNGIRPLEWIGRP